MMKETNNVIKRTDLNDDSCQNIINWKMYKAYNSATIIDLTNCQFNYFFSIPSLFSNYEKSKREQIKKLILTGNPLSKIKFDEDYNFQENKYPQLFTTTFPQLKNLVLDKTQVPILVAIKLIPEYGVHKIKNGTTRLRYRDNKLSEKELLFVIKENFEQSRIDKIDISRCEITESDNLGEEIKKLIKNKQKGAPFLLIANDCKFSSTFEEQLKLLQSNGFCDIQFNNSSSNKNDSDTEEEDDENQTVGEDPNFIVEISDSSSVNSKPKKTENTSKKKNDKGDKGEENKIAITSYTTIKGASGLIRWIHYDPFVTRLFCSAIPILSIPLVCNLPTANEKGMVIWQGRGVPLSPAGQNTSLILNTMARGFQFGMSKVLPLTVTSLLIWDLVNHGRHPELRFGTTLNTVFSGFASNEQSISTRLFSNFPHETTLFWRGPILMVAIPFVTLASNLIYKGILAGYKPYTGSKIDTKLNAHSSVLYLNKALFAATQEIVWSNSDKTRKKDLLKKILTLSKTSILTSILALWYLRHIIDSLEAKNNNKKNKESSKSKKSKTFKIFDVEAPIEEKITLLKNDENELLIERNEIEEGENERLIEGNEIEGDEIDMLDYALIELSKQRGCLRALYIDYLLYSIGYFPPIRKKPITAIALFFITALYLIVNLYGHYRFGLTLARKTIQFINFLKQGGTCEYQGQQFTLRDFEYICGVCPEWPFVPLSETTTAQGCFDALLKQQRDPNDIVALTRWLMQQKSNNQTSIDPISLVKQDWVNWQDTTFEDFFNALPKNQTYQLLNFSHATPRSVWTDQNKLDIIANFIQQNDVINVDFDNQGLGDAVKRIVPALSNQTLLEMIRLGACAIDDDVFDTLTPLFQLPQLKIINLKQNKITPLAIQSLLPQLNNSNLEKINMDQNDLSSQDGLDSLGQLILKLKHLSKLSIGEHDFSNYDFTVFGQALLNSTVRSLNFQNTQLGTFDYYYLSLYLKQLTHFNVANNVISATAIRYLMDGFKNGSLVEWNLANCRLDNQAVQALANGLPAIKNLSRLILDNTGLKDTSVTILFNGTSTTTITHLDLSNNALGNGVTVLTNWLNLTNNLALSELKLSNTLMSDSQGAALIKACSKHSIKVLTLSRNFLGGQTAQAIHDSLLNGWDVTTLDLTHNKFNATDFKQMSSALNVSQVIDLKFGDNTINNTQTVIEFSKELISPISDGRALGEEVVDPGLLKEIRGKESATKLDIVELDNTDIDTSGALALCRIQQAKQPPHYLLTNNPAINTTIVDPQSCNIPNSNANFTLPSIAKKYANNATTKHQRWTTGSSNYKTSELLAQQGIIFNNAYENEANPVSQNTRRLAGGVAVAAMTGPTFLIVIGSVIVIVGLAYALHFLNTWMNNTEPHHNHDDDQNFKF